jgi:hypothetical protein
MIRDITDERMICAEPVAAFVQDGRAYGFIPAAPQVAQSRLACCTSAWAQALQDFRCLHEGTNSR